MEAGAPQPQSRALVYLMLALAVLSWAGNWVIGRALRFDAPPVALTFWRWALAFALLAPFTWRRIVAQRDIVRRSWKIIVVLGLLATVCQHIPIYVGLRHTTATNGALLNAASPVFIMLLSAAMTGERLHAKGIAGIAISICGVLAIVSRGDILALRALSFNSGDLWVLAATLAWAFYTVFLRWQPAGLDRVALLTLLAAVGTAAALPLYLAEIASGQVLSANAGTLIGVGYIGVIATVAAYILWNRGVEKVGPSRAGQFMYLMLVFTPLLAIVFLGEQLHLYHVAGTALIVAGISLATSHG